MPATYPAFAVAIAPGIDASAVPTGGDWVDITADVVDEISVKWGRFSEFGEAGAGTASLRLKNNDGTYDPDNSSGAYYGDLVAGMWVRIKGGTTSANTDVFYGHVSDDGFRIDASQFPDSFVRITLVDDLEQLSNTDLPESVYAIEVEADTPGAWWRLGESSGIVATDSSGNGLAGVYAGGATFNSRAGLIVGSDNPAIEFDGVDDAVEVPPAVTTAAFSIEAWFIRAELSASDDEGGTIYEQGERGAADALSIWVADFGFAGDDGKIFVRYPASGSASSEQSTVRVDDGAIHHLVVARSSGGDVTIYIDSVDRTAGFGSAGTDAVNTTVRAATIGSSYAAGFDEWFSGTLDEVAVYGSELSAARVLAHYEAGTAPWEGDDTGTRVGKLLDAVNFPA